MQFLLVCFRVQIDYVLRRGMSQVFENGRRGMPGEGNVWGERSVGNVRLSGINIRIAHMVPSSSCAVVTPAVIE